MASGLLAGLLPQLEIPTTAQLIAVETHFDEDGAQTWTVTFRSAAAVANAAAAVGPISAAAATQAEDASQGPTSSGEVRLPRPPPLSDLQIAGDTGSPLASNESRRASNAPSGGAPPASTPLSPTGPGPFPLLPFQVGATNRLFPLRCSVMTYAWGRHGHDSLVGRLAAANDPDFSLEV